MNYFQDFETKAVKAKYKIWKRKQAKALNTISVVYFLRNPLVYRKSFTDDYYPSGYFRRTGTIHPGTFGGRAQSIRVFLADGHYLNNRVFLSRNYRLIVAPRKFHVLKTNISPRSEASRANMLVLRTSNFQGATIRPIVPRHKHSIVFIVHH